VIDFIDAFIGDVHFDFRHRYEFGRHFQRVFLENYQIESGRELCLSGLALYQVLNGFHQLH